MAPAKHLPVHGAQFSHFDIDPEIGGDDDHLCIGEQDEGGEDDDDFFDGEDDDDIYMIETNLTDQHDPIRIMPLHNNTFHASSSQHVERVCQVPGQSIYKSGGLMCSVCSTMLGMCISSGVILPPSEDTMKDYQSYLVTIMSQSAR